MKRKDNNKNKGVEKINKVLRTFKDYHQSFVLKKVCNKCLSPNNDNSFFCSFCGADIHNEKIQRICKEV
jgi:hypothetical protein